MITLPPAVRIYLCATLIDGRRGIDALAAMVRATLDVDPFSGHLFVFLANRGKGVRILFWDRNGFALALHFTQEDAQELSSQLNKALQSIAEAKELTLERTGTTILIGQ